MVLATALYAVFASIRSSWAPVPVNRAIRISPQSAAASSTSSRRGWRCCKGGSSSVVGVVPVFEGAVLALLLRALLRIEPKGDRDLGRLAIVAGAALAFATVAIPLQLKQQWITIGWALEGAALAWLYRRIPHRGLLYSAMALLVAVFVRLALNPVDFRLRAARHAHLQLVSLHLSDLHAARCSSAAWWLSRTDDRLLSPATGRRHRRSCRRRRDLLFLLLNIEIADFYATGPEITFRFGVSIAQDLTYTIGWLVFGLGMLPPGSICTTGQAVWRRSR